MINSIIISKPKNPTTEISKNFYGVLMEFKVLVHPIRLSMLMMLNKYNEIKRSDLLKMLNVNSGTLDHHFKILEFENYVSTETALINSRPSKVIYITTRGIFAFREFISGLEKY